MSRSSAPLTATDGVETTLASRPLRKDAAENRERLLVAAKKVFAAHGLDAGVEDVAREAGLGMGTLYRRFPTKELLITELVLELTSELRDLALDCLNRTDGSGLETFLFSAAQLQSSNLGCLTRLWRDSMSPELLAELRGVIAALVADARSRHTLRPEVTPADISVVLWSLRGVIETARDVAPDAWRRQLEIVMAGLRPNDHVLKQPPLNQSQLDRIAFAAR